METKAMTLRLHPDQAAELEAIARADQIPVAEAVRAAITQHIESRRTDPEFRKRLQEMVREDQEVLQRLAR